jgi:hypothetical protein
MGHRPNTELVAVAWLKTVVGTAVGTTLPREQASWATSGFVQVRTVGGSTDPHVALISPVVSVDCWAVTVNASQPPWGHANTLAETIRAATYSQTAVRTALTLPAAYNAARLLEAYLVSEPIRQLTDSDSFARYQFDMSLHWVAL